jgi:hypothetical protein
LTRRRASGIFRRARKEPFMRRSVRVALFASLAAGLGFLLAPIPNIELFTFSLFFAGYALGWRSGGSAALLAVLLFYGLNPYGSSLMFPPLFAAQLLGGICISSLGAAYGLVLPGARGPRWLQLLLLLPFAAVAALILPLLPMLVFPLLGYGSWQGWAALGLLLTAWGFVFNLIVFTSSLPPLARQLDRLGGIPGRA